jgi:hypothetical protein
MPIILALIGSGCIYAFFFFISWGFLYAFGKIGNSLFFFAVYSMRLQMYKYIVFMYSVSPDSGDLPPYFI